MAASRKREQRFPKETSVAVFVVAVLAVAALMLLTAQSLRAVDLDGGSTSGIGPGDEDLVRPPILQRPVAGRGRPDG
jgi:hypothetical protein